MGHHQTEIAECLEVHKSTISRELRRNKGLRGYRPKHAHQKAMSRRNHARIRIKPETWAVVEANQYQITPQQVAFLILASLGSPTEHVFKPSWVTILLSNQRSNGSWYGEPMFFVPNKGAYTTWHSSHQLTTVFCYHALKTLLQVTSELEIQFPQYYVNRTLVS